MSARFAQRSILWTLAESGADYVVIGGHAVAFHGHERSTHDVDIVYSADRESCERLAAALRELRAEIMFADRPAPRKAIDGPWLAEGGHTAFATEGGKLDALTQVAGFDYPALRGSSIWAEVDGSSFQIVGYDHLVAMKEATDRPKDELDLKGLREVRDHND